MIDAIHNRLTSFLVGLECLDAHGQHDAFMNEVLETFGRFDPPARNRSHLFEIDLHSIQAEGTNADEAMANWKRLAHKKVTEDDGFITVHPATNQIEAAQ